MNEKSYPVARNAVFRTVQGEGALCGTPMIFVRLGGCSVGCPGCDTDYRTAARMTAGEIRDAVKGMLHGGLEWAWITGGEPLDHDIAPLVEALREAGVERVCLATAGTRDAARGSRRMGGVDFLSVSPHDPIRWVQRSGDQLNIVPGLNGLSLSDPSLIAAVDSCWKDFSHLFVTPMHDRRGRVDAASLDAALAWVNNRAGWRLGWQAHKQWGVA